MTTKTKGVMPKAKTQGSPLTKQGIDDLMKAAFALTHKIHAVDKYKTKYPKGSEDRAKVEKDAADLREQREMIVREIKRRAGE